MNSADMVIENAKQELTKIRAARARHMAQRLKMQRKAEAVMYRPATYILKKYGGQQLMLDIGVSHDTKAN